MPPRWWELKRMRTSLKTIVVATRNAGKTREFARLLEPLGLTVRGLSDCPDAPDIVEDGDTFADNALKKARTIAEAFGLPVLADDSGLSVEALGGRPGVHSARYAGPNATDADRINKLLSELQGVPDAERTASFHCALVLAWPGDGELMVEGLVQGRILHEPRGEHGFGYDPIFYVPALGKTFAELTTEEKNKHSHRAKAAELLVEALQHAPVGR